MTVNWTPFLTLFPLRLPAKDMLLNTSTRRPRNLLATGILDNLRRFPHCILLTRVGQFYESYFDQAKDVSRLLNIKLTQRTWDGERIWMCGFPLMHLDKYLKILVQNQKRFVAMCEEFPRNPQLGAKAGFDRRVVRIVTPGTLIDEPFLNPYENNYLLAIGRPGATPVPAEDDQSGRVGLAWIDVSTGEFFTKTTSPEGLRDELVRISPREVILGEETETEEDRRVRSAVDEEGLFVSYFTVPNPAGLPILPEGTDGTDDVVSHLGGETAVSTVTESETRAVNLLTAFMQANLLEHMPLLSSPSRETTMGRMQIDSHTIKALEIREGLSDGGTTGSLISVVKRTVTTGGTRLLARWLCSPSTSLREITARQSLVAFFHARPYVREDLLQLLGDIEDTTRIAQRFLLGRGHPSDLAAICSTVRTWTSIRQRVELEKTMEQRERGIVVEAEWTSIDALLHGMHDLWHLVTVIQKAMPTSGGEVAEGPEVVDSEDTGSILDALSGVLNVGQGFGNLKWTIEPSREQLERRLQSEYNAPSLTLRSSPGYGMHVHIGRGKRDSGKLKASDLFVPISESGSTNTFFFREWSALGTDIMNTVTAIYTAEKEAFEMLREEVNVHAGRLRSNARIIDELDVTLAFAMLATEMNFVRPTHHLHVTNGRHPTVELALLTSGRNFVPNTVSFTHDSQLHIITGPNMAGKSTFLRQTALIAILAQSGSFVPADAAHIGIIDRVFSRVGAKDDLFRDRSTFMVEMLETSEILRRATPRSLVIMDEVGRGTTVDDGLAIAFAAVHHLVSVNRCRALFATHFHELADMLDCSEDSRGQGPFEGVSFFCTDVDETEDDYFSYSHLMRPGVNRDSHGLKVAQLAGLPEPAVNIARTTLVRLKEKRAGERRTDDLRALGRTVASNSNV
ncbi:muts domain V-domain-containing protein [Fomitopsis serialis]|uniref:muts domain V-domain-containing protein n=1 Tax=Fomitopsis serialis TaxID=139415 RepID=UPI002007CCE9|nr:muts domain V-domain-containing protein [Neoantrodia serialis]KAH9937523.1 muts domain V-domain-containing protein [Neoantrodia serialis]